MKKILFLLLPLVFVLTSSCQKDKDTAKEISGSYVYTLNGSLSMTLFGKNVDMPMLDAGTAVITNTDGNEISIKSDGYSYKGTVKGDKIKFDKITETEEEDGLVMHMTLEPKGTISGETITVTSEISGNATGKDIDVPIKGSITIVFTKM